MSTPGKKSLTDAFKKATSTMAASIGVTAAAAMGGSTVIAGVAPVMMVGAAVGSMMGAAMNFNKKSLRTAEIAAIFKPAPAAEELEISVETGAPVKAMKTIRLRR